MNEPLAPLPPEVTELFDEERKAPGLSPAAKGRLVARLAAFAPMAVDAAPGRAPSGSSVGSGGGGAAPAATAAHAVITKIALTALVLGVGAVGGAALQARYAPLPTRTAPSGDAVVSVAPRAEATSVPSSTSSTLPLASPVETPVPIAAPRASASAFAPRAAARDDGLRRERASLEVARTGITRGDFDAALGALSRHSRDFPNGQLSEERDSMIVQALVGLRRDREARAAAAQFRRKFPGSLLQSSVDAAIATIR